MARRTPSGKLFLCVLAVPGFYLCLILCWLWCTLQSPVAKGKMQKLFSDLALQLHPRDNIAIAKHELTAGRRIAMPDGATLTMRQRIPAGHKFALQPIAPAESILRYGYAIGVSTQPIQPGEWVHTHNLSVGEIQRAYDFQIVASQPPQASRQVRNRRGPTQSADQRHREGVVGRRRTLSRGCL